MGAPFHSIPPTCKAGVVKRHGQAFELAVEEVRVPRPGLCSPRHCTEKADLLVAGPSQLLLKLNCTGICYSDIHYMLEDLPLPRMGDYGVRSPGHEGAGVVVAVGEGVTDWKIGDRAGVKPTWDTCMSCELCLSTLECHCAGAIPTGLKVPGKFFRTGGFVSKPY
jgi:propanol-preferring alcohol dehydrogenase